MIPVIAVVVAMLVNPILFAEVELVSVSTRPAVRYAANLVTPVQAECAVPLVRRTAMVLVWIQA